MLSELFSVTARIPITPSLDLRVNRRFGVISDDLLVLRNDVQVSADFFRFLEVEVGLAYVVFKVRFGLKEVQA